jgi:tetratricopeptide (TPR) repeat protein
MHVGLARALCIAAACFALAGCGATTGSLSETLGFSKTPPGADANASLAAPASPPGPSPIGPAPGLLGSEQGDELNFGKRYFAAGNFGMAEQYFRRAVETHPRDAEAWLNLAASYDRLRRFDLADRAYAETIRLVGPRVAILNDQGFSYMLRGDFKRAREKLEEARAKDPANKFVQNNLRLLADAAAHGKAVE